EGGQGKKEMLGIFGYRSSAGDGRFRVDQIHGRVSGAAFFTVIAVLVFGFALGTGAFDIAVREEEIFLRVISLGNVARGDMAVGFQAIVNQIGKLAVFLGVGGVKVIEVDMKIPRYRLVIFFNVGDMLFRRDALFFSFKHDRGAVGIVGAKIQGVV